MEGEDAAGNRVQMTVDTAQLYFTGKKMYIVLGNLGTSPNLHIVAHSYHKVLYKAVGSYSSVFLRDSFQIQSSMHRDILQSSWLLEVAIYYCLAALSKKLGLAGESTALGGMAWGKISGALPINYFHFCLPLMKRAWSTE